MSSISGFESFSTIGFGDRTPASPAGRSIFIVWALLGVGTMTILISGGLCNSFCRCGQIILKLLIVGPWTSFLFICFASCEIVVLGEAFSSRYEKAMQSRAKQAVIKGREELDKFAANTENGTAKPGLPSAEKQVFLPERESSLRRRSSSCPQLRHQIQGREMPSAADTLSSQLIPSSPS